MYQQQSLSGRNGSSYKKSRHSQKQAAGLTPEKDILSRLIQLHERDPQQFDEAHLIGYLHNLLSSGNVSRATVLSWAIFLLNQHPETLAAVREELVGVCGPDPPTLSQLGDLPLLEAVLQETQRLLPTVNWLRRLVVQEVTLGEQRLTADTHAICALFVTQRLPDLFPHPDQFRPRRWLEQEIIPYSYLAFGMGARKCLGTSYALMEMKLILAMILARHTLTVPAGAHIDRRGYLDGTPSQMPVRLQPPNTLPARVPVKGNIEALIRYP